MGVNSGKFYDATKMRNYCDSMKKEIEVYAENADISQESFSRFEPMSIKWTPKVRLYAAPSA